MKSLRGHEIDGTGPFEGIKHTPTPWHTSHINETYPNLANGICVGSKLRIAADEYVICETTELRSVDRPNFEFIVRAVNAHDNLVRLLALVRPYVHQVMDLDSGEFVGPIIDGILEAESIAQSESEARL
jgi:hypothetical protein